MMLFVYARILADGTAAKYGMIECIQETGDTIFVPEGWWHTGLSLACTSSEPGCALKPLAPGATDECV